MTNQRGKRVSEAHFALAYGGWTPRQATAYVFRLAMRLHRGNEQNALDLAQDIMERLVGSADSGVVVTSPAAYIKKKTTNLFLDNYRKEMTLKRGSGQIVPGLDDEALNVADTAPGPEGVALSNEEKNIIYAAIKELSPVLREVVELAIDPDEGNFQRITQAEIAQQLGISPKLVKSRMHDAKEKLAEMLKDMTKMQEVN
jgi:RNA polymerase sigma factor (sigma-70 family)